MSDENWERVRDLAKEHKCRIHTHVHETRDEVVHSKEGTASMSKHKSDHKIAPLVFLSWRSLEADLLLSTGES